MLWQLLRRAGAAGLLALAVVTPPAPLQADELEPLYGQYKVHLAARRYDEAEAVARRMVAVAEQSSEEKPELLAESLYYLADACSALHRYAEAETAYRRSAAIREEIYGPDYLLVADRPDRFEPRYKKRRSKRYAELILPRREAKLAILKGLSKN